MTQFIDRNQFESHAIFASEKHRITASESFIRGRRVTFQRGEKKIAEVKAYGITGRLFVLLGKAVAIRMEGGITHYVNKKSFDKNNKITKLFKNALVGKNFYLQPDLKILLQHLPLAGSCGNRCKFNELVQQIDNDAAFDNLNFNDAQIEAFTQLDLIALRGYDRVLLAKILTAAEKKAASPSNKNLLNIMIAKLETKVVNLEKNKLTMHYLGGGAVNSVYALKSEDGKTVFVFKPDPSELGFITKIKESHFGTATAQGIPAGEEAHLPYRAVASSIVDASLYGETHRISVKTEFTIVEKDGVRMRGILMSAAAGESPSQEEKINNAQVKDFIKYKDGQKIIYLKDYESIAKKLGYKEVKVKNKKLIGAGKLEITHLTKQDLENIGVNDPIDELMPNTCKVVAQRLHFRKVKFMVDKNGVKKLVGIRPTLGAFHPNNIKTMEDLLRLQIKDIITGECDRHPQNYFIAKEGSATGIDEDCCFGVNAFPEEGDVRAQKSLKGFIPNNASLMLRMPPCVTEKIKEEVLNLQAKCDRPGGLAEQLSSNITEEEIAAAKKRLDSLVAHLDVLDKNGLIVKDAKQLYEHKHLMDSNNSYWAREVLVFDSRKKGWNYLREHRTHHPH